MIICNKIFIYLNSDKTVRYQYKPPSFGVISLILSDLFISWQKPKSDTKRIKKIVKKKKRNKKKKRFC